MKILALVTARGGSKGFPGKNVALLRGRPLVAWSHAVLGAFRRRHADTRIWLSTDSEVVRAAWPEQDRPHRLRPAELARDVTPSIDVVEHELIQAAQEGFEAEAVLLLQPTSPLIAIEDLEATLGIFESGCPSVIGTTPLDHPIQWAYYREVDGALTHTITAEDATRRQDLREAVRPAGFYLCSKAFLKEHRRFLVPGITRSVLVPAERGVDIDAPADLALAAHHAGLHSPGSLAMGARELGEGHPCFVIAEAGVNHNGDYNRAMEMVRVAARAGADAIKFQTFKAEDLVTAEAPKARYQVENTGEGGGQLEMLRRLELRLDDYRCLKEACEAEGILFMSTPFESGSARVLEDLGVAAYKLGSGELTNLPFLRELAAFGRPMIVSTGMGSMSEVLDAVAAVREAGNPPLALLHCLSAYPAPCDEYNLRAMASIEAATGVPVGLSDHTMGWEIALAAVAMGAKIIEKHFTLDRELPGPDHKASLEPGELALMIAQIRRIESALGDGVKRPMPSELDTRAVARKSLVAARALAAGTVLTPGDIVQKRPGSGISPAMLERVLGRRLKVAVDADALLSWDEIGE